MPDFYPSRDGATFRFGQTAKILTEDVRYHVPVQWEVTVDEPTTTPVSYTHLTLPTKA